MIVSNANQCLDLYNEWAQQNSQIATPIEQKTINDKIENETAFWQSFKCSDTVSYVRPPNDLLKYRNDDDL